MKIKIIDLFNKIANNEKVPKHILLTNIVFHYDDDVQDYENDSEYLFRDSFSNFDRSDDFLNIEVEEVEIIEEEKEIEKIDSTVNNTLFTIQCYIGMKEQAIDHNFTVIQEKINKLVDEINKLKKRKNMEDQ